MPIHEYQCAACGHVFEEIVNLSDNQPKECPVCRGTAVKIEVSAIGYSKLATPAYGVI